MALTVRDFEIKYTLYTPTAGGQHEMTIIVQDTTWARATGQVVGSLEAALEAGDVYNYRVEDPIFGKHGDPIWGWEPDEDETICV